MLRIFFILHTGFVNYVAGDEGKRKQSIGGALVLVKDVKMTVFWMIVVEQQ